MRASSCDFAHDSLYFFAAATSLSHTGLRRQQTLGRLLPLMNAFIRCLPIAMFPHNFIQPCCNPD
jgi:hypothetical protein